MSYVENDDILIDYRTFDDIKKDILCVLKNKTNEKGFKCYALRENDNTIEIRCDNIPSSNGRSTSQIENDRAQSRSATFYIYNNGTTSIEYPDALDIIPKYIDDTKFIDDGMSLEEKVDLRMDIRDAIYGDLETNCNNSNNNNSNNINSNNNNNNNTYNNNNNHIYNNNYLRHNRYYNNNNNNTIINNPSPYSNNNNISNNSNDPSNNNDPSILKYKNNTLKNNKNNNPKHYGGRKTNKRNRRQIAKSRKTRTKSRKTRAKSRK